ncbi:hypothetical protein GBA52_009918 [Prunus armeniaca]|nr:hypothetical protein GBA52_009918 [Prunus armeniaca]
MVTPPTFVFNALQPKSKLEAVGMKRIRTTEPDLSSSGDMGFSFETRWAWLYPTWAYRDGG